jgi:hypothetical protein
MRVPFSSRVLNVSNAAQDQKKKEVARNQGVKKIQEKKGFNWAASGRLGLRTILLTPLDSYSFSPLQNRKVLCFAKTKNKEIQHISLFI